MFGASHSPRGPIAGKGIPVQIRTDIVSNKSSIRAVQGSSADVRPSAERCQQLRPGELIAKFQGCRRIHPDQFSGRSKFFQLLLARHMHVVRQKSGTSVLTSGIGVLLGCTGFLAYDMHGARQEKWEELRSTGELIGMNSTAALEFGDELAGTKLLASLSTRPDIRAGTLYRTDGTLIAYYVRADLNRDTLPRNGAPRGMAWTKDRLTYYSTVSPGPRTVGSLYLESGLTDLQERLRRFEQLTALIALCSLLAVYLLTAALQRGITTPIQNLAAIARSIAAEKSYSLRAPPLAGRELRQLGADFNHMLDEIEKRDSALSEARDVLELRVAARTGELEMEVKERRRTELELHQRTTFLNTFITNNPLAIAVGGPH